MIFVQLWQLEEVPKDWRKGNVTAVFREGKKEDPGNYRLSSLTSFPGKVVEQLMPETIFRPVKDKVIRSSQHGFAEGKSCLSNLISFYEEVTSLVDKGRAMDIVFLDFIVAFDAVTRKFNPNIRKHTVTLQVASTGTRCPERWSFSPWRSL